MNAAVDNQDLLARPAKEAVRRIGRAYLDDARAAFAKLGSPDHPDALHDFRVAVRRLRSLLRAYAAILPGRKTDKVRRTLKKLQRATNESRDLEVRRAWLATLAQDDELLLPWRVACERDEALAKAAASAEVHAGFPKLDERLGALFDGYKERYALDVPSRPPALAEVLAPLLHEHIEALRRALASVTDVRDSEHAHFARIAGKRLRYLLEPLRGDALRPLHKRMKALQDILGELHDRHVFMQAFGDHRVSLPDAVRTELVGRAAQEAAAYFATLERDFLNEAAADFFAELETLAAEVQPAGAPLEIERKYLLTRLPVEAARADSQELWQGYLPGEVILERLRKIEGKDGVRCLRTLKFGKGLVRTELEEEIPLALFEQLWPLTVGKRVHKRRYEVRDGAHTFEVDAFLDRDLVLAEVELDSKDDVVELPAWLRAVLVREVTDEEAYVNARLAK